jgi:hypothetical protein
MKKILIPVLVISIFSSCSNSTQNPGSPAASGDSVSQNQKVLENDLESPGNLSAPWTNLQTVVEVKEIKAHSGTFVSKVTAENQFSIGIRDEFRNLNEKLPVSISITGWYYLPEMNDNFGFVLDIQEDGKTYVWKPYRLNNLVLNQWTEFSITFNMDEPIKPNQLLKIYGNGSKKVAYIDDIKITFEY